MSNAILEDRAKALQRELSRKIKGYVRVGWMKEADGSTIYTIYVDQRVNIDYSVIPGDWFGSNVLLQLVLPPGVSPPDPFPDLAWM